MALDTNRIAIPKVILGKLECDMEGLRYRCARPADVFVGVEPVFGLHRMDSTSAWRVVSRHFRARAGHGQAWPASQLL